MCAISTARVLSLLAGVSIVSGEGFPGMCVDRALCARHVHLRSPRHASLHYDLWHAKSARHWPTWHCWKHGLSGKWRELCCCQCWIHHWWPHARVALSCTGCEATGRGIQACSFLDLAPLLALHHLHDLQHALLLLLLQVLPEPLHSFQILFLLSLARHLLLLTLPLCCCELLRGVRRGEAAGELGESFLQGADCEGLRVHIACR
mmetsp:Transcript_108859/g.209174  ORF Transcript_108859/g.209174 Transcript_108859/m.209174 type:complete len:205 (-) Transcript_108859:194-808(-)